MADMNMKFSETKIGDVFDDMVTNPQWFRKVLKYARLST